jgi:O-antigen ligase
MKTAIKWSLLVLAFIPLLVDTSVFFPYITGKTMLVRVAMTIAAILFAAYVAYSSEFRKAMVQRTKKVFKNPIISATFIFFAIYIISSIFAVDSYRAFFGDVERAEGVFGMVYFYVFLLLSVLVFEKKDWINLFKLTLVTGAVLFINEMIQVGQHIVRPASFTGNPIYLAAFYLFVMLSALIVIINSKAKSYWNLAWKIISYLLIPLSVVGIFYTESRGVIVGIGASIAALAVYFIFRGKEIKVFKGVTLKTVSLVVLGIAILSSATFLATQKSDFWKKIPGLDRLSQVSATDTSTQTRLVSFGIGLKSIDPRVNGIQKFLIGWGPENFHIAFNIHFNPRYFEFEQLWFDRAHDKLMDVAVMNGFLGLIAYLALWIAFFWKVAKKKEHIAEVAALIFFGVAYFVQNLFVFDSISTYLPFFAMLGYGTFLSLHRESADNVQAHEESGNYSEKKGIILTVASAITAVGLAIILWAFFLVPYFQMQSFLNLLHGGNAQPIVDNVSSTLTPYTYAQENIRNSFLDLTANNLSQGPVVVSLFGKAVTAMEELAAKEPWEPRNILNLGKALIIGAQVTKDSKYIIESEYYLKKAYDLAPLRPDLTYALSYDLAIQGKFDDAISLLNKAISIDPNIGDTYYYLGITLISTGEKNYLQAYKEFELALNSGNFTHLQDGSTSLAGAYERFLKYFYQQRDTENFVQAATRLEQFLPDQKADLEKIIDYAKGGNWVHIKLLSQ